MHLTINKTEKLLELPDSAPFSLVMQDVSQSAIEQGSAIRRVSLNGKDITGLDWSPYISLTVAEIEDVAIEIGDISQLARETLDSLDEFISDLTRELMRLSDLFRTGEEQKALEILVQALDGIQVVSFTTQRVIKNLHIDFEASLESDKTVNKRLNVLDGILTEMFPVQEAQDWVRLADLIEYELVVHLEDRRKLLDEVRREFDG